MTELDALEARVRRGEAPAGTDLAYVKRARGEAAEEFRRACGLDPITPEKLAQYRKAAGLE